MSVLNPVAQGFLEGLQLVKAIAWTVPKVAATTLAAIVVSFVMHRPIDSGTLEKTLHGPQI